MGDNTINLLYDQLESYNNSNKKMIENSKEDPAKCVVQDELDDYTIQTVKTGEVCTINVAKSYGIFGKTSYFNSKISMGDQSNIDVHINNSNTGQKYSLCTVNDDVAYTNCALLTGNPWKTLNSSRDYCMIPTDVTLPLEFSYNNETHNVDKIVDGIIMSSETKNICSQRWYDWFSIPDYHLGNKFLFDKSNTSNCFRPCSIGYIPIVDGNKINRCIERKQFQYGFYSNSFLYLPISLVVLLGSTKESLLKYYDNEVNLRKSKLRGLILDHELYQNIVSDQVTRDNIYSQIKQDLREHIKNLMNTPFDESNIMAPSLPIQNLTNSQITRENIKAAYAIAKQVHELHTDPAKKEELKEWKYALADVSGLPTNSDQFYKQLLILKKAINVTFDAKTSYSKNLILYTLNTNLAQNEEVKNPISIEIGKDDIIKSLSSNIALNVSGKESQNSSNIILQNDLIQKDRDSLGGMTLNKEYKDPSDYETEPIFKEGKQDPGYNKNLWKTIIMALIILIFSVFIIALAYVIVRLFWPFIATILNEIILGNLYFTCFISDMFRGPTTPSNVNVCFGKWQKEMIDKKIAFTNILLRA